MSTYKAASLLYTPVSEDAGQSPAPTIAANLDRLTNLTLAAAAAGADIMVWPESWSGTLQWPNFNRSIAADYAEVYPVIGVQVCDDMWNASIQHYRTACLAKNASLYIVANIPEYVDCRESNRRRLASRPEEVTCDDLAEKRVYLFNALAIYDRTGTLIAKYRKTSTFPLYFDTAFPASNKEETDFTTFDTDFGVEFGVLICADATHPKIVPQYTSAGIRHLALPLYDGGRPPVSSITGIHAGHSARDTINVIASQSQTYSGVGVYSSGEQLFWDINMDPFSGVAFEELIVVDLDKDPVKRETLAEPPRIQLDQAHNVSTCRWLGYEDTEVECPCIRVDVVGNTTSTVNARLQQPVILNGTEAPLDCRLSAQLHANVNQTYAVMLGFRNSSQLDMALFCELVVCNTFPDCSKDCPLCVEPYVGMATLDNFSMVVDVPDYFVGDRIMKFPVLNSLAGRPRDSYVTGSEGTKSWMVSTASVPNLMGAGFLYVGFAPLAEATDGAGFGPASAAQGPACAVWLLLLMAMLCIRNH